MSEDIKSCFNCKFHPMCKIFDYFFIHFHMDVNHINYTNNFKALYNQIAIYCFNYSEKSECHKQ